MDSKTIAKTSYQQEKHKVELTQLLKPIRITFIVASLLPLIILFLFNFNIFLSRGLLDPEMEASVAKVQSKNKIGTAFLVSPTRLLTARHVVEGMNIGDEVQLVFDKAPNQPVFKAKIIYYPTSFSSPTENGQVSLDYFLNDFAVLETAPITDINPLMLGESDVVNNLDEVILIGFPLGDYSITQGNINNTSYQGMDLFKLDATSNPGNSGGPCILKSDKTVIGILVGGGAQSMQGENIAVKISNVLTKLKSQGINIF